MTRYNTTEALAAKYNIFNPVFALAFNCDCQCSPSAIRLTIYSSLKNEMTDGDGCLTSIELSWSCTHFSEISWKRPSPKATLIVRSSTIRLSWIPLSKISTQLPSLGFADPVPFCHVRRGILWSIPSLKSSSRIHQQVDELHGVR